MTTTAEPRTGARSKLAAALLVVLVAVVTVVLVRPAPSRAASSASKSVSQIAALSEKQLLALIREGGCTTITYDGPNQVGTLCSTSARTTTTTAPPAAVGSAGAVPAQVLDLSHWYEGIPVNTSHDGNPDIIRQPELASYTNPDWFHVGNGGVIFRVLAGGYTTSGSSYPRSELREMADTRGRVNAAWDSTVGTNVLDVTESIDQLPPVKPDMVAAQIHDASSDVIEVELSGSRLYVKYANDTKTTTIDRNYQLGTKYALRLVATASGIQVFYNGTLVTTIKQTGKGWYFKAGAYLQSNVSKGERADAPGQVTITALSVSHSRGA